MKYIYNCAACKKDQDILKSYLRINDREVCKECGREMERQFTFPCHITLKGPGFAKNDG
tara:strand:- start:40 stop:216 length:177 start_codon:yes stop_codon:yes gene_type:complete